MQNLQQLKQEFNALSAQEQYNWLINFPDKSLFKIGLDNDCTDLVFNQDENTDYMFIFKRDVGNRAGVELLFKALGILAEGV